MPASPTVVALDRSSDTPLWLQLSSVLRGEIESGRLQADQALPSESELIDRHGVSRTVVREALADLVRGGLIYKVRARGSFVSPRRPEFRFIGSMMGSSADLQNTGRTVTTRVISFEHGTATAEDAEQLRIAEGDPVICLRRLRLVDNTPWLLVDTVLPERRFPNLRRNALENQSFYDHIRRHYGVQPKGADRWISAIAPSPEDAELLQLAPNEPVLAIESIAWDDDDAPFERYHALHRSGDSKFYVGIR